MPDRKLRKLDLSRSRLLAQRLKSPLILQIPPTRTEISSVLTVMADHLSCFKSQRIKLRYEDCCSDIIEWSETHPQRY
jgi:hypothetical protein